MPTPLRRTTGIAVLITAIGLVLGASPPAGSAFAPAAAQHDHAAHDHSQTTDGRPGSPAEDPRLGMVFDGLTPGRADGPCAGSYEAALHTGHPVCSHGPDPAPDGVDVTAARDLEELEAAATETSSSTTSSGGVVACIGDGTSGNRVQAVYAVAADRTDRFDSVAPLIAQWAAAVDGVFEASARETGGSRHVRYVTNPDCSLSVARVTLSPTGDDNVANTAAELQSLGLDRPDRKYLVWTDATVYCGIAYVIADDRPGPDNANNGAHAGYARVDSGCWGRSSSTEAHELMHTLGGVQRSAPHATSQFHCTDEWDRMCYADGAVSMSYPCASAHEATFDCGHDDYFHTSPDASSYLATHWNVATSSFLDASGAVVSTPTTTTTAPSTSTTSTTTPPGDTTPPPAPTGLSASPGDRRVTLGWSPSAAPDVARYSIYRDGARVASTTGTTFSDTRLVNGVTVTYYVVAEDTAGNVSVPSDAVTAAPQERERSRSKPVR